MNTCKSKAHNIQCTKGAHSELTLHERFVGRNVGIPGRVDEHPQALVGEQRAQDDHGGAGDEAGLPQREGDADDAGAHDARYEVGDGPTDAALGLVGRLGLLLEGLGSAGTLDLDERPGGGGPEEG